MKTTLRTATATAAALLAYADHSSPVSDEILDDLIGADDYLDGIAAKIAPFYRPEGFRTIRTTFPGLVLEGEGVGFLNVGTAVLNPLSLTERKMAQPPFGAMVAAAYDGDDGPTFGLLWVVHSDAGGFAVETPEGGILPGGAVRVVGLVVAHFRDEGQALHMDGDGLVFRRAGGARRLAIGDPE